MTQALSPPADTRGRSPFRLAAIVSLVAAGAILFAAGSAEGRGGMQSYTITSFRIEGNHAIETSQARKIMALTKGGRFRAGRYLKRWLDRDVEELLRVYRAMGYLEADVVERRVVRDREKRTVDILLVIDEGERTLVGSVAFEGLPDLSVDSLVNRLSLVEGEPFDPTLLGRDQYRIFSYLAEKGYPGATVEYADTTADHLAAITFLITSGPRARVGEVTVIGNETTRSEFVLRELTFARGEWFNRVTLLQSRDRLFQTGLYRSVIIAPGNITPEKTVPIRVEVRERKLRWFGFGAGFGTEDQFRGSVDWNDRNVLGSGRRSSVEIVFSDLFANRAVEQRYQATLIEPWMFNTRTAGALSLTHQKQNIENFQIPEGADSGKVIERYRLIETKIAFSLSRELRRFTRGSVSYSIGWADARDPTEPVDSDLLKPDAIGAVTFSLERDSRDHLLDPSRGSRSYVSTEYAGTVLGGDNHYLRSIVEGASYSRLPLGALLAYRIQVGQIRSLAAGGALPDYKRFRLGGANTVRGYREGTIGTGNYSLLANVEVRVPLFWKIAGAVFLDSGGEWEEESRISGDDFRLRAAAEDVRIDEVRYGAGGGLRLATPVGPVRLDYGVKLKPALEANGDREAAAVWHISIGQAY